MFNVAAEGAGSTSADERWIYLSDGGHLDNTGMVECVRHCVVTGQGGRVLVLDASNDPVDSWAAAGDAVAVIRSDLNLDLRAGPTSTTMPPWARRYRGPGLDVLVCKAVRTPDPTDAPETPVVGPAAAERAVLPAGAQGLPAVLHGAAEVR